MDTTQESTPASSPPPEAPDMNAYDVSESMLKEEEQIRLSREKEDAKRDQKLRKDIEQEKKGGEKATDSKFKALEYLLNQSKVCMSSASDRDPGSQLVVVLYDHACADAATGRGG